MATDNTLMGVSGGLTGLLNGITEWISNLSLYEFFFLFVIFGAIFFIIWGFKAKAQFNREKSNRPDTP